ncbi:MAG TPA: hypothetical protein VMW72_12520 [Sedimentisphaerales bacterium]|nr:hypothetical protein [Sedimentisphaerales bacterium]
MRRRGLFLKFRPLVPVAFLYVNGVLVQIKRKGQLCLECLYGIII